MEIRARDLRCTRTTGPGQVESLCGVSLRIPAGASVCITGPEGSGNTLLLRVLGLLESIDQGELFLGEAPSSGFDTSMRASIRAQYFGFVFCEPYLLPSFSVVENVAMPLFKVFAVNTEEARDRVEKLLVSLEIPHLAEDPVDSLSTEEQMRVALARALVNEPRFLFFEKIDETLNPHELGQLLSLARRVSPGSAIVAIGKSELLAERLERRIAMEQGRVISDSHPDPE